ncbi:PAS domain S-box protein [Methanocella sp. MCL-LM]|uniref:PAS domain S-box protein n=1 Tax=Methanocella sp. MCL-LM TaxID=3412035 RepID=UPI003C728F9C
MDSVTAAYNDRESYDEGWILELQKYAWVPVVLFIVVVGALYCCDTGVLYQAQVLLTALNVLFNSSVSLLIVYLATRSYLKTGSRAVLLLGCGALSFAVINLLAGILVTDTNDALTVYNTGICLAGLCFIGSAVSAIIQKPDQTVSAKAPQYMGLSYLIVLVALSLLTLGTMVDVTPAFFTPEQGFTLLRQVLIAAAVVEFIVAAACFGYLYSQSRTPFLLLYSLGLLMIGAGVGVLMICGNIWTLLGWMGRVGQYLGALYMLLAVVSLAGGEDRRIPLKQALRVSEEKYRNIVDTASEGILICGLDARTTFINKRMGQMTGYSPEEMIGKPLYDFMDEEAVALTKLNLERRRQGMKDRYDQKLVRKDGTTLWVLVSASPLTDENRQVTAALLMLTDITERKLAEEALIGSKAKLEAVFESMSDAVFVSDSRGNFLEFNQAFAVFHRFGDKEECYKTLAQYPDYIDVYFADGSLAPLDMWAVPRALRGERVSNARYMLRRKDTGESWWGSYSFGPIRDAGGKIVGSVVVARDITEVRQAEEERERLLKQLEAKTSELEDVNEELEVKNEELAAQTEEIECANEELRTNNEELQRVTESMREAQEYLESLINNANAPIIVWDPKFTITRFNRAFEWLSGYTAKEVLGRDLSILFPLESRDESLGKIKKTLDGEQWDSVEIPILHKSGNIRIALWNSANVYSSDHSLLATIAQGQDITARKQVEKALEEEKAQAELYLDLMGHDISNLHQIALMQLELAGNIMNTRGKLEAGEKEIIDTSYKTLLRAARLIDNVRKLQKLKLGEYSLEIVDMARVLEDVLNEYSSIPGRDVKVKFAQKSRCLVRANPLLRDIFSNLMDNSIKHSRDPLEIGVDMDRVGQNGSTYYRVAIEDNGNGIPDDKKGEVFQRFKRGHTVAKGTGLGLYLVKSLVEGFGGHVEVQNRVLGDHTKGTRFIIYIPAAAAGDTEE